MLQSIFSSIAYAFVSLANYMTSIFNAIPGVAEYILLFFTIVMGVRFLLMPVVGGGTGSDKARKRSDED